MDILLETGGDVTVAARTIHRRRRAFARHMATQVADFSMTAHTGVLTVCRSEKVLFMNSFIMTGLALVDQHLCLLNSRQGEMGGGEQPACQAEHQQESVGGGRDPDHGFLRLFHSCHAAIPPSSRYSFSRPLRCR